VRFLDLVLPIVEGTEETTSFHQTPLICTGGCKSHFRRVLKIIFNLVLENIRFYHISSMYWTELIAKCHACFQSETSCFSVESVECLDSVHCIMSLETRCFE
jgi:hypothetical protein